VKEKRTSNPEVNQSQIAVLQDKIFADLENFENSALIESGRSSQASIVQNYFEENPLSSAGIKKFDGVPFGRDLDLFRQKFKKAFPNQPDKYSYFIQQLCERDILDRMKINLQMVVVRILSIN